MCHHASVLAFAPVSIAPTEPLAGCVALSAFALAFILSTVAFEIVTDALALALALALGAGPGSADVLEGSDALAADGFAVAFEGSDDGAADGLAGALEGSVALAGSLIGSGDGG